MSLMKKLNKTGLITDPCGNPRVIVILSLSRSPTLTLHCTFSERPTIILTSRGFISAFQEFLVEDSPIHGVVGLCNIERNCLKISSPFTEKVIEGYCVIDSTPATYKSRLLVGELTVYPRQNEPFKHLPNYFGQSNRSEVCGVLL